MTKVVCDNRSVCRVGLPRPEDECLECGKPIGKNRAGLTPWQEEVYAQLDRTWKRLDEIAAGMGRELSGSGYESAADELVEKGLVERERPRGEFVPMGKVYRRVL